MSRTNEQIAGCQLVDVQLVSMAEPSRKLEFASVSIVDAGPVRIDR